MEKGACLDDLYLCLRKFGKLNKMQMWIKRNTMALKSYRYGCTRCRIDEDGEHVVFIFSVLGKRIKRIGVTPYDFKRCTLLDLDSEHLAYFVMIDDCFCVVYTRSAQETPRDILNTFN